MTDFSLHSLLYFQIFYQIINFIKELAYCSRSGLSAAGAAAFLQYGWSQMSGNMYPLEQCAEFSKGLHSRFFIYFSHWRQLYSPESERQLLTWKCSFWVIMCERFLNIWALGYAGASREGVPLILFFPLLQRINEERGREIFSVAWPQTMCS